jgi:hypothetical protein|tara:strand:+ start:3026 stop:3526 length:501 start_codon:yes stop_codon:yes gene_type:complete
MQLRLSYISLIALFLTSISFAAQDTLLTENVLILRKRKSAKRVYYIKKNPIVYKANDSIQMGIINEIAFDSILIDTTWIKYNSITSVIDPSKRQFIKNGSVMFPIAGVTFAFITTFNSIINRDKPIFYREHLIPSVGLIGLGVIMWPFKTKKYRTTRKWEFMVMPS